MIDYKKIEDKFLKLNPKLKKKDLLWRIDGRMEWVCEHGVGHTVYAKLNRDCDWIHGCCEKSCCLKIKTLRGKK